MNFKPLLCSLSWLIAISIIGLDVKEFGAVGDGKTDDSAALRRAAMQIMKNGGGTLNFPAGIYRIGPDSHGMVWERTGNLTINFADGAVLLMDNLRKDGSGGGHGMVFRGPARNIELNRVQIQWKQKAAKRSAGDGLRFEGFPDDRQTIADIRLNQCRVSGSPQTGAVFMGCSDIAVRDFSVENTWADGLHFNACRRIDVNGYRGIETGDDGLAFVTYYAKTFTGKTGTVFSLAELGEWNNSGATARNLHIAGGRANGIRLAGSSGVEISHFEIRAKSSGIIIDAGVAGGGYRWQYLPSRNIRIHEGSVAECDTGFYVQQFNADLADASFRLFDVAVESLRISGCRNDSVHIAAADGVRLKKLETVGCRWRFRGFRNCSVEQSKITHAPFLIFGDLKPVFPDKMGQDSPGRGRFQDITISGGRLAVENCNEATFQKIILLQSPLNAITVCRNFNSSFSDIRIDGVNAVHKKNQVAIQILQSRNLIWNHISISGAENAVALFEIGGGNRLLRSGNITIKNIVAAPSPKKFLLQGGAFAPDQLDLEGSNSPR